MLIPTRHGGHHLEVRRIVPAPPGRVFDAWTRPEEVQRWSAPGAMTAGAPSIDLRVGGRFSIPMRYPDGREQRAVGTYLEVEPPRRLVYTWRWETEADADDTRVSVEFIEREGATEVVLRHDGFPTALRSANHTTGWTQCLAKLAAHLEAHPATP